MSTYIASALYVRLRGAILAAFLVIFAWALIASFTGSTTPHVHHFSHHTQAEMESTYRAQAITEDMPEWNCRTMGNGQCGPHISEGE